LIYTTEGKGSTIGYGRKGRKSSEIPEKELASIRRKERASRRRAKIKIAADAAAEVKEKLAEDLGRELRSTEIVSIESEEMRRSFIQFLYRYNGNVSAACAAIGIPRSRYTRWLSKYDDIRKTIEEVNEAILDMAEQQLLNNISKGKENSLFFLLCNKGKHRGWQDIRKLTAPKLQAIKININYPGKKTLPHIDVQETEFVESEG